METKRKILSSVVSMFLFLTVFMTTKSVSAASCDRDAYCCGSSCQDLDPQGTNCMWGAGHYGLTNIPDDKDPGIILGTVELIYSPKCQANWARVECNTASWVHVFTAHPEGSGIYRVTAEKDGACSSASGNYIWSLMTDGGISNAAVGEISAGGYHGFNTTNAY